MDINKVITEYLNRGFGSMNKNDFEVWIFNELLNNQYLGKSNFDISIGLKIPESKVKRLRYEARLKYGNPEDINIYKAQFENLLQQVVLKKDGNAVQFVVEDISLRKYLDSVLKKDGRFSDSSFNSEIVTLDTDDLEYLEKEIFPDKDWTDLFEKAEQKRGNKTTLKNLLNEFAKSAAKQAGKIVVNLTFAGILNLLY